MVLLAGKLYDPATAVSKATSALLALTAIDVVNLRLTFTVPASGSVVVRMRGAISGGAGTLPAILLGVLEVSTVKGRAAPLTDADSIGANNLSVAWVEFLVTGLTPGASLTWDAAYAVQVTNAASPLKYGGPNDNAGADAWGGFEFSIWDPAPAAATPLDAAGTRAALGMASPNLDTQLAEIEAEADAIGTAALTISEVLNAVAAARAGVRVTHTPR